jgi:sugar phosphate isomerase/epimerase
MSITLGAYTACLHDRPLGEALDILKDNGLTGVEVNVGGFIPSPHCPVESLLASAEARADYLAEFTSRGLKLTGLNTSGNPLSPLPGVGPKHANDLRQAIQLAGLLGVRDVVTMSGAPGSDPGAAYPSWVVNPWDGVYMDVIDYQWSVAVPFWREIDALARANDVHVALELHPHNLVFTPLGYTEFAERTGATNVGVNLDPSHLMWQGMDIPAVIRYLGDAIVHVHAKDTKILPGVDIRGVLDTSFTRVAADAPGKVPTGIGFWCNNWPQNPPWRFVALGDGHDTAYWHIFLSELAQVVPNVNVNIEHEDAAYGQTEGLAKAASVLLTAAAGVL